MSIFDSTFTWVENYIWIGLDLHYECDWQIRCNTYYFKGDNEGSILRMEMPSYRLGIL